MTKNPVQDVALIVGGGPGISSSCARLFAKEGMRVAVAARQPDKPVLADSRERRTACAGMPATQPTPRPSSGCSQNVVQRPRDADARRA